MKLRLSIVSLALFFFLLSGLILAGDQKSSGAGTALLNIKGMTCDGCASQVKSALTSVSGVKDCQVDWKAGQAEEEPAPLHWRP